jgi:hypothetical protein
MRRYKLTLRLLSLLLIIGCCSATIFFWWGSYYLPFKPCRPITFPDGIEQGQGTGLRFSYTVDEPIDEVLSFYDSRLLGKEYRVGGIYLGQWNKQELGNSQFLYYCYGGDINLMTSESGCIYVRHQGQKTRIAAYLYRSEGANTQCSQS